MMNSSVPSERVAGLLDRLADDLADLAAELLGHRGARRLLDHLLVAALERALALAERPHAAVLVGEDLELDVRGRSTNFSRKTSGFLKPVSASRVADWKLDSISSSRRTMRMPRPPPPPEALRMTGKPMRLASSMRVRDVAKDAAAGEEREAEFLRVPARGDFVAPCAHRLGRRADEAEAALLADARELGVLGEEAVARVDRVGAR